MIVYIVTLAYPLNILVMLEGSTWICALCRLLLPSAAAQGWLSARCQDQVTELVLWLAAIGAALLMSCGLRVLTRMWDIVVSVLLVMGGITTVAAITVYSGSSALHRTLAPYLDEISLLFILGDTIFTALCGYWLARASPQAAGKCI